MSQMPKRWCAGARRWTGVALVLSAAASGVTAQPLVDANGFVREEAYDHLRRALSDEDAVYADIEGSRLKTWLEEVVAF